MINLKSIYIFALACTSSFLFGESSVCAQSRNVLDVGKDKNIESVTFRFANNGSLFDLGYQDNGAQVSKLTTLLDGPKLKFISNILIICDELPTALSDENRDLSSPRVRQIETLVHTYLSPFSSQSALPIQVFTATDILQRRLIDNDLDDHGSVQVLVEYNYYNTIYFAPPPSTGSLSATVSGDLAPTDAAPTNSSSSTSSSAVWGRVVSTSDQDISPKIALKTNLLSDLALVPSLELEIFMGKDISLAIEGMGSGWNDISGMHSYRMFTGGLELRAWFSGDGTFCGHNLALYCSGGSFDFADQRNGYQGNVLTFGVGYNYYLSLSRHFGMEFGFGLGYIRSAYSHYSPSVSCDIYEGAGVKHFVGPTKAKISLVWRIGNKK